MLVYRGLLKVHGAAVCMWSLITLLSFYLFIYLFCRHCSTTMSDDRVSQAKLRGGDGRLKNTPEKTTFVF